MPSVRRHHRATTSVASTMGEPGKPIRGLVGAMACPRPAVIALALPRSSAGLPSPGESVVFIRVVIQKASLFVIFEYSYI
jgi:hypothetical protein